MSNGRMRTTENLANPPRDNRRQFGGYAVADRSGCVMVGESLREVSVKAVEANHEYR